VPKFDSCQGISIRELEVANADDRAKRSAVQAQTSQIAQTVSVQPWVPVPVWRATACHAFGGVVPVLGFDSVMVMPWFAVTPAPVTEAPPPSTGRLAGHTTSMFWL
jgi:hypothetical protein